MYPYRSDFGYGVTLAPLGVSFHRSHRDSYVDSLHLGRSLSPVLPLPRSFGPSDVPSLDLLSASSVPEFFLLRSLIHSRIYRGGTHSLISRGDLFFIPSAGASGFLAGGTFVSLLRTSMDDDLRQFSVSHYVYFV